MTGIFNGELFDEKLDTLILLNISFKMYNSMNLGIIMILSIELQFPLTIDE